MISTTLRSYYREHPRVEQRPWVKELLSKEAGKPIRLGILRGGVADTLSMQVASSGQIGFIPEMLIEVTHEEYSIAQAASIGTGRAFSVITDNVKGIGTIEGPEAINELNRQSRSIGEHINNIEMELEDERIASLTGEELLDEIFNS
jgi:hypothetical protein